MSNNDVNPEVGEARDNPREEREAQQRAVDPEGDVAADQAEAQKERAVEEGDGPTRRGEETDA